MIERVLNIAMLRSVTLIDFPSLRGMCTSVERLNLHVHVNEGKLQIPDYKNAVIVAKSPGVMNKATSYADRLRLGWFI